MSPASILLLALGLSADAMAVSATLGLSLARVRARQLLSVMAWFGLFQGGMALLGSQLGEVFGSSLEAWDHWIAFVLLSALGIKMLWEASAQGPALESLDAQADAAGEQERQGFAFSNMMLLAFATSIDALAVGVTLPLLGVDVAEACAVIALVTALMSALGLWAGQKFGDRLGRSVDRVGGALLIVIGLKILLEHLGLLA